MRDVLMERALVDRLRAGDATAVLDLQAAYGAKIYQLALRYMKNHEDAEEVTQDVLFRVFRKIPAFRGDAALSSWIYRITFNTAMSRLRSARFSRPFEVTSVAGDGAHSSVSESASAARNEIADWSALADDEVLKGEFRKRLVAALRSLPALYRLPVLLRDVRGLSTEEASAVLRIQPETLKSRLHRGRLVLRERLAEFADGLTLHRVA